MWNALNRIGNTVSIPGRILKTWLTASADVFDTLAAIPKDMGNIVSYTSDEIKNVFKSAWTKWKRYQKVWNTMLSPFIALWVAVEWAVRGVVTPTTNFVINTFNTWKNLVSNTINSTFGSAFSKNPVSDFRYEELKTANVIEKNKNWLSKWRLSRKVFQDKQWEKKTIISKQPNKSDEPKKYVKDAENNKEVKSNKEMKDSEYIKDNKDSKDNKTSEKNNDTTQNCVDNWTTNKQENKVDSNKKTNKETKNENTEGKNENNPKETSEIVEKNVEHRWVNEAKQILDDSPCGKIIIDWLCANYKDFWIIFNNAAAYGSCNYDHTITIWTKMPSRSDELAPFNWADRDPEFQKKHLLLHELWHCTVASHSQELPGIQKWLNIIQRYIDERKNIDWKTLSLLSYSNNIDYDTSRKKAREDFVEMLALRMNRNWDLCKKYLKLLSDNEHKSFRENHWLIKITKEDASKLQRIFDSIVHYYENMSN